MIRQRGLSSQTRNNDTNIWALALQLRFFQSASLIVPASMKFDCTRVIIKNDEGIPRRQRLIA